MFLSFNFNCCCNRKTTAETELKQNECDEPVILFCCKIAAVTAQATWQIMLPFLFNKVYVHFWSKHVCFCLNDTKSFSRTLIFPLSASNQEVYVRFFAHTPPRAPCLRRSANANPLVMARECGSSLLINELIPT